MIRNCTKIGSFEQLANRLLAIAGLLALGIFQPIYGQTLRDNVFLFVDFMPESQLRDVAGSAKTSIQVEMQAGLRPVQITSRLKWIQTLYARSIRLDFADLHQEFAAAPSRLNDLQYGAIFLYDFQDPRWSIFISPRIIARSDSKIDFSSSALFFNGIALLNYNPDQSKRLVWSVGFALANDFNRNVLIPIAGVTYNDNRLTIEVAYPRVNALYKPNNRIEWGVTAGVNGGIFRVKSIQLQQDRWADYVRVLNVQAGQTFNYKLSQKLIVNSFIGYAVVRNYDFMDDDFKLLAVRDLDQKGSFLLRTGISARL